MPKKPTKSKPVTRRSVGIDERVIEDVRAYADKRGLKICAVFELAADEYLHRREDAERRKGK